MHVRFDGWRFFIKLDVIGRRVWINIFNFDRRCIFVGRRYINVIVVDINFDGRRYGVFKRRLDQFQLHIVWRVHDVVDRGIGRHRFDKWRRRTNLQRFNLIFVLNEWGRIDRWYIHIDVSGRFNLIDEQRRNTARRAGTRHMGDDAGGVCSFGRVAAPGAGAPIPRQRLGQR
jgi:hypothetical protein